MSKAALSKNRVAVAVGWYDFLIGLWPLLAPESFKSTAGRDDALPAAKIVGFMWSALGAALLLSSSNRKIIPVLGIASTLAGSALAVFECALVSKKKLPSIFLVQALIETTIGAAWMLSLTTDRDNEHTSKSSIQSEASK